MATCVDHLIPSQYIFREAMEEKARIRKEEERQAKMYELVQPEAVSQLPK